MKTTWPECIPNSRGNNCSAILSQSISLCKQQWLVAQVQPPKKLLYLHALLIILNSRLLWPEYSPSSVISFTLSPPLVSVKMKFLISSHSCTSDFIHLNARWIYVGLTRIRLHNCLQNHESDRTIFINPIGRYTGCIRLHTPRCHHLYTYSNWKCKQRLQAPTKLTLRDD